MAFEADEMCFACGKDNPIGLHLDFVEEGESYLTVFTASRPYQGYEGIIHGGILATVLDEIMARYAWVKYGPAATARLEVRYKQPAPTGTPITVRSVFTAVRRNGRLFDMAATASMPDGTLLAEATALVMRIMPEEMS